MMRDEMKETGDEHLTDLVLTLGVVCVCGGGCFIHCNFLKSVTHRLSRWLGLGIRVGGIE